MYLIIIYEMIIPIRCFTCGMLIANKWDKYIELIKEGKTNEEALNTIKLKRICCRRMMITHKDIDP